MTGAIACFWLAGMPTAACWAGGAGSVGAIAITININDRNYEGVTVKDGNGKDHQGACNCNVEISLKVLEALQTWADSLAATVPVLST